MPRSKNKICDDELNVTTNTAATATTTTTIAVSIKENGNHNGSDSGISDCDKPEILECKSKRIIRDQWKTKIDFLIALTGFSVGLGNVWRFPYLCYKNGGGAFLIPYFTSVFLAGIPLFILEVTIGQLTSRGVIAAWNICPLFQGIGYACMIINTMNVCYYTVILAWAYYYLFSSFTGVLPWTKCDQSWNTPNCYNSTTNVSWAINSSTIRVDPSTEFWENRVLGISNGISNVGTVKWDMALCLLTAWLIIFLCIFAGIKTSGKVMYVTATAPYLFLITLLIRTSLLDGAKEGITYYLSPEWSKLKDMAVWSDAGTQIFFSYSIGLGSLTALGSYNKFHHNGFRDCILFALINTITSLLAGFVIFATLGNMSYTSNVPISEVAEFGPGLAFVIYPRALGTMPGSPFWAVCFFIMIIFLGIDSMFGGVEGLSTAIADYFPWLLSSKKSRGLFVGSICAACYLIGLSMVTNGGMYIFQLFDYFGGSRIIVIVGLVESLVVGFIYGGRKITKQMKMMYGVNLGWVPTIVWCFLTPVFSTILLVFSVVVYETLSYKRGSKRETYIFPDWSVKLGWCMAASSVFMIPVVMVINIIRAEGNLWQRIKNLCQPHLTETAKKRLEGQVEELTFIEVENP